MLRQILQEAIQKDASDIHLKVGMVPMIRKYGELLPMNSEAAPLTQKQIHQLAFEVMSKKQKEVFFKNHEVDLSCGWLELGRFRLNIFKQQNNTRIVIRVLPSTVPSLSSLNLPKVVENLCKSERGLVLVTGAVGSGKSTTLASMLDYINTQFPRHILTIEDPIEFFIQDKKSLVTQRELGSDTTSFYAALRSALRQDPNVIFIGEMRDLETMEIAFLAATTGHLVFSTLHTLNAVETVNRVIGYFPVGQQQQIRLQLASTLKAVISQRLVQSTDNKGFVPAVEVLINTARIREMIEDPKKTIQIKQAIEEGYVSYGMQTFDQSLINLVIDKVVDYEEAIRYCTSPDDFSVWYSGLIGTSRSDNKGWKDKTDYREHIKNRWQEVTNIELEQLDEKTPVVASKSQLKKVLNQRKLNREKKLEKKKKKT